MTFSRARIAVRFLWEPDVGWTIDGYSDEIWSLEEMRWEVVSFGTHWETPAPEAAALSEAAAFLAEYELRRLLETFGQAQELFPGSP
jgi:hypothetical protein